MKHPGARHTYAERQLMKQVATVFSARKHEKGGARRAARELKISLASFYNYAGGKDLPRMEVLRDAQELWDIKWDLINPAEILRTREVQDVEQLVLAFLDSVRQKDVTVAKIERGGKNTLRVALEIRFVA